MAFFPFVLFLGFIIQNDKEDAQKESFCLFLLILAGLISACMRVICLFAARP